MWTNARRTVAAIAISLLTTLTFAAGASAATYTPGTFDDQTPVQPDDCIDGGDDCTIREAVEKANSTAADDDIDLAAGTYLLFWDEGPLVVDPATGAGELTIAGEGARQTIIDSGTLVGETPPGRIITFRAGSRGILADLALTNGSSDSGDDSNPDFLDGGAMAVEDDEEESDDAQVLLERVRIFDSIAIRSGGAIKNRGKLTIEESLIDHNRALESGGAIENDDELFVINSTIANNEAGPFEDEGEEQLSEESADEAGNGGGIDSDGNHAGDDDLQGSGGFTVVESSTIANNTAAGVGGGISSAIPEGTSAFDESATPFAFFSNSIVSENSAAEDANCSGNGAADEGPFASSFGHNIERGTSCLFTTTGDKNADPKLGDLADNGGDTDTLALLDGSPAIDAADDEFCPEIDQRGEDRPAGAQCDMGAYEAPAREEPQEPNKPSDPLPQPQVPQAREPRCTDRQPPLTRLTRRGLKINSKGVHLRGTSRDRPRDCASGVQRVEVSLARVSGTGLNCRFQRLTNEFLLSPFQNCRQPIRFVARGQNRWRFTYKIDLPPGKYRAQARGYDNVRNKETPKKRRNIIFFKVK